MSFKHAVWGCSWRKIKTLNIVFKPLCCKCTQAVNMWILLWLWGQRSSSVQTGQGVWHLTSLASPSSALRTAKTTAAPQWWVKSTITHFYRHKLCSSPCQKLKCQMLKHNTNSHVTNGWKMKDVLFQMSFLSCLLLLLSVTQFLNLLLLTSTTADIFSLLKGIDLTFWETRIRFPAGKDGRSRAHS